MDGLNRATILYLLFIAICANAACWQEALTPEPATLAGSLPSNGGHITSDVIANFNAAAGILTELSNANCRIGQSLAPGDVCTYPGTSNEFRVDSEGKGHFLFFTATTIINAQNANINGQNYDFSATKQDGGDWVIELVGTSVDAIMVSDLIAPAVSSLTSTASANPAATQEEGLPSASPSGDSGTLESASVSLSPVAETTSSFEPVSDFEPAHYSSVEIYESELPPVSESNSTNSAGAGSVDATASRSEAPPLHQNRSPDIIGGIGDQTVTVGESTVIDIGRVFSDADGDELERYVVILSNTTVASETADSSVGSLTLTGLRIGSSWVAVKACDHAECSSPEDLTFRLAVEPPSNRAPQAVGYVEDQEVTEGKAKSVSVRSAFSDFEGDRIIGYEVKIQDDSLAKVTVDAAKGVLRFTGIRIGSTSVSVRACDFESCGNDTFGLRFGLEIVAPPNSPPVVTGSIGDQSVSVGEVIQLDVSPYFDDPDGDQIKKYYFSQTEDGIADGVIDSTEGILNIEGVAVGTTRIAVNASDGSPRSEISNLTFNLEVSEPPPELPQVVRLVSDQTVELGGLIRVPVSRAFNAPSQYRIIRYDFLVDDREVVADSKITRSGVLTLRGSAEGKSRISVRACSRLGCSDFSGLSFVLTVTGSDKSVNRRPEVVGGVFSRSLKMGETFTMDVSSAFSDPDGESIVDYRFMIGNPAVAAGSNITNAGVLILHGSEPGTTTVAVIACDDEGKCSDPDDMEFTLTVETSVGSNQGTTADLPL